MNNTATKAPKAAPAAGSTVKLPRKKKAALDAKKARAGWFFVLPFVIGMIVIYLPIIFDSIKLSFHSMRIVQGGGYTLTFVGWENYSDALFADTDFVRILTESIRQLILDVPAIVIFALFMAIVLNQKMIGRAVFRAIFFVPVIISTGIIDTLGGNMMDTYMSAGSIDTGGNTSSATEIISAMDVSALLGNMVVGTELVEYVVNIVNGIFNIVNRSGVQMLVFLAGLQSINPSIYESCKMEGATPWETFWKITFPMISPMILVNAIYTVIDSFTSQSNSVMSYINNVYLTASGGRVLSTAMSWIYFVLVILLLGLVALILSSFIFYQRRD